MKLRKRLEDRVAELEQTVRNLETELYLPYQREYIREQVELYLEERVMTIVRSETKKDKKYYYGQFVDTITNKILGEEKIIGSGANIKD